MRWPNCKCSGYNREPRFNSGRMSSMSVSVNNFEGKVLFINRSMMELADVTDLKSVEVRLVPVQVRLLRPHCIVRLKK